VQPQDLFTVALGLQPPWQVADIRFDAQAGEIHFDVACTQSRLACPVCAAAAQPVHDRKARTWQHLHFFQYRAYVHAEVPRVRCGQCGKTTQMPVPWARSGSGFTLLFEAMVVTLAQQLPVRQVARLLGVSDARLWRPLKALVEAARTQADFAAVRQIGVDEKHVGRLGFISVFHDADQRRVLFTTEGRKAEVFARFVADLTAHGGTPQAIEAVSMDLSGAYRAGAREHLPAARQCFDPFHLVKLAHTALEQVRRAEVRTEIDLRGIRWATLKRPEDWTFQQFVDMQWLSRSGLQTARAWRLKERLREIIALARNGHPALPLFKGWISWARRSRLVAFKRLGATLRDNLDGILNTFERGLSNAPAESINAHIQAAIVRARGFRTLSHLQTIIYLVAGKLTHLPASPYELNRGT
jgi:transposase